MNYEDMSDFEINKAVLLVEDVDGDIESITCRNTKLKCINSVAVVKFKGIDEPARYNPCNNPSDAWSIIVENKIAVWPESHGEWQAMRSIKGKSHIRSINKNPLRAAMICFLKMKDAEK